MTRKRVKYTAQTTERACGTNTQEELILSVVRRRGVLVVRLCGLVKFNKGASNGTAPHNLRERKVPTTSSKIHQLRIRFAYKRRI